MLNMLSGTHQGRKSSPIIFDAVLWTWPKKKGILDDPNIDYENT